MMRQLKFHQAVHEGIDVCLARDPSVYLMGLGAPDPKGIFGTTLGLQNKYGPTRVMDMPTAENGMTGIALGSSLVGMRPIMVHQRMDFAILAMEQITNEAAKWHYMFGGIMKAPMVIRMIVGRGWGNGPQHSQSLQSWFAHIPGLVVIMPASAHDAKGLLIASVEQNNPVIFIEHRWLYNISGPVPEGHYTVPIGRARVVEEGTDLTIVCTSYMTLEAHRAVMALREQKISAELVDVRTLRPLDTETILKSVRKTGRVLVCDTGWKFCGFSAEIIALITESEFSSLKAAPRRIALPDCPTPTTVALAGHFYPKPVQIMAAARELMGLNPDVPAPSLQSNMPADVPDNSFTGPF